MNSSHAARILVVAVLIPVLVAATGVLLMLAWLPDAPAIVALQWDFTGHVTTTAPAFVYPLLLGGLGVIMPAGLGGSLVSAARRRGVTRTLRFAAGASLALSVTLAGGLCWSLWSQRGMQDAAAAPAPFVALLVSALVGALVATGVAALVLPVAPLTASEPVEATPLELATGERAAWLRTVIAPASFFVLVSGVIVLVTAIFGALIVASGGRAWGLAIVPALLVALLATTSGFRVRVDEGGLTVRSVAGFPRFVIPLSDVRGASVADVAPMADFGGWGVRSGLGRRFGVIVRSGEGLEVERASGRRFVVTVDDAATAAALLLALSARDRPQPIE